ncbi:DUF829-domain-containing protein [Thozetella sp. PMI_491]|nr:DUF829-domain-containing protein [Thozetella sp. PMI_491]
MGAPTESREKKSSFEGFIPLTDKIHLFEPGSVAQQEAIDLSEGPKTILLYTWGDAHPKHVTKYTDGYRKLYPLARIVLVQCTMMEAMFYPSAKHHLTMLPVLDAALLPQAETDRPPDGDGLLVHVMSNSGTTVFISSILAYQKLRQTTNPPPPFPHALLIFDSAPGSLSPLSDIMRWGRALAVGAASRLPVPLFLAQGICVVLVAIALGLSSLLGGTEIGWLIMTGIRDSNLISFETPRLYLYSKGDVLVAWETVEQHIAEVKSMGFQCTSHVFEESPHVGHARMYPERYWGAIDEAWKAAAAQNM